MKLLVMACSMTKRADPAPMPCIDRYDGPMWRTLRARLALLPDARAAIDAKQLRVMVLSAQHGFLDAIAIPIGPYDRKMTPQRATELCQLPTSDHHGFAALFKLADDVMFAGGEMYRNAMGRAAGGGMADIMKVTETEGGGIGEHRAELGRWLATHFARAAQSLAA